MSNGYSVFSPAPEPGTPNFVSTPTDDVFNDFYDKDKNQQGGPQYQYTPSSPANGLMGTPFDPSAGGEPPSVDGDTGTSASYHQPTGGDPYRPDTFYPPYDGGNAIPQTPYYGVPGPSMDNGQPNTAAVSRNDNGGGGYGQPNTAAVSRNDNDGGGAETGRESSSMVACAALPFPDEGAEKARRKNKPGAGRPFLTDVQKKASKDRAAQMRKDAKEGKGKKQYETPHAVPTILDLSGDGPSDPPASKPSGKTETPAQRKRKEEAMHSENQGLKEENTRLKYDKNSLKLEVERLTRDNENNAAQAQKWAARSRQSDEKYRELVKGDSAQLQQGGMGADTVKLVQDLREKEAALAQLQASWDTTVREKAALEEKMAELKRFVAGL